MEKTMKKLFLRLNALDVQSFPTSVAPAADGSVTPDNEVASFGSAINMTECSCYGECPWH
jgi:hypothetical protein